MAKNLKIVLFLFVSCAAILNFGCSGKSIFNVTYEGHIYDTIGGNPSEGASITLHGCYKSAKQQCPTFVIGNDVADGSGHFKIKGKGSKNSRYWIEVHGKNGRIPFHELDGLNANKNLYLN